MTKLAEGDLDGQYAFLCECGCCWLRIVWDGADPDHRFLWVQNWSRPHGLDRIRHAWRTLRGIPTWHSDIVLDERTAKAIAHALTQEAE